MGPRSLFRRLTHRKEVAASAEGAFLKNTGNIGLKVIFNAYISPITYIFLIPPL